LLEPFDFEMLISEMALLILQIWHFCNSPHTVLHAPLKIIHTGRY